MNHFKGLLGAQGPALWLEITMIFHCLSNHK